MWASTSARLDRLPAELTLRIAQHLERSDARNLATVCRSLQDAGESVVWREVSLTPGRNWDMASLVPLESNGEDEFARDSCMEELNDLRRDEQLSWEHEGRSPSSPQRYQDVDEDERVDRLETALRSRPARIKHIRRLTLDLSPYFYRLEQRFGFGEVLTNIEELDLNIYGPKPPDQDQQKAQRLSRYFCSFLKKKGDRSSGRLRKVELRLSGSPHIAEKIVAELFRLAPNITELSLGGTPGIMAPIGKIHPEWWSKSDLTSLKTLFWVRSGNQLAVLVEHLFQEAPNIEETDIRNMLLEEMFNTECHDAPPPPPGVLKALAKAPSLLRLRWFRSLLDTSPPAYATVKDGFDRLREITLFDDIGADANMALECIDIPCCPALVAINISAPENKPLLVDGYPELNVPMNCIHPEVLNRLRDAPSLSYIQFGGSQHWRVDTESSTWVDKGLDMIVIRTYGEGADQLVHTRRLLCHQPALEIRQDSPSFGKPFQIVDGDGFPPLGSLDPHFEGRYRQYEWEDWTDFQGLPVPLTVLAQFYSALEGDEAADWAEPSRGASMSPEALRILKDWRSSQGPAWHIGRQLLNPDDIRRSLRQGVETDRGAEAQWEYVDQYHVFDNVFEDEDEDGDGDGDEDEDEDDFDDEDEDDFADGDEDDFEDSDEDEDGHGGW